MRIEAAEDLYRVKCEISIDPATRLYPKKGITRVVSVQIICTDKHHWPTQIKSHKYSRKKYNLRGRLV